MDRRGACLLALALGLAGGGAGCVTTKMSPGVDGRDTVAQRPPEDPKKSCAHLNVAYARVHESRAGDPATPQESRRLFYDQARMAYLKALEAEPKNADALLGM